MWSPLCVADSGHNLRRKRKASERSAEGEKTTSPKVGTGLSTLLYQTQKM